MGIKCRWCCCIERSLGICCHKNCPRLCPYYVELCACSQENFCAWLLVFASTYRVVIHRNFVLLGGMIQKINSSRVIPKNHWQKLGIKKVSMGKRHPLMCDGTMQKHLKKGHRSICHPAAFEELLKILFKPASDNLLLSIGGHDGFQYILFTRCGHFSGQPW